MLEPACSSTPFHVRRTTQNLPRKSKSDTSLQEKLQADADAVLTVAKEAGFMISTDDLKKAQSEISDEELEGAAGRAVGDTTGEAALEALAG